MNAREGFLMRMAGLAQMVPNFTLSKEMLMIYEGQLKPMGYERVNAALDQLIGQRTSRDPFPSIKEIRAVIHPEMSPESHAVEIAGKIVQAVSRIGPYQASVAREALGPIGWELVQQEGGWESLCQSLTYDNLPVLKAQWRKSAAALLERKTVNEASDAVRIEDKSRGSGPMQLGDILKQIPKGENT